MNRVAAASGAFNAFGSISCMIIVKRIWTCHMEFALYKLVIIIIIINCYVSCICAMYLTVFFFFFFFP